MPRISTGVWLKRRWEQMGYSAEGLAQLSGVSRRTLQRLAAGGRMTIYVAQALAGPLKLSDAEVEALAGNGEVEEG